VFVLREGQPRPVRVKPGVTDGTYTEVEGELREGDQVITALAAGAQAPQGTGSGQLPGTRGAGGGRAGGGFGRGPF
jgi:HlyD family secretion protein